MTRLAAAAALALLLAACQGQADTNAVLAEANSTGNEASAAVENAVAQSSATPLQKEQALALMKERHDNYEKIGDAMKVVGRELKAAEPDLAAVRASADTIAKLAPQAEGWFPAGTGPDVGKTDAKAEIWQQPTEFAEGHRNFRAAATAFRQAAQGSDVAAIKAAAGDLGKTCKSCHDRFRSEN